MCSTKDDFLRPDSVGFFPPSRLSMSISPSWDLDLPSSVSTVRLCWEIFWLRSVVLLLLIPRIFFSSFISLYYRFLTQDTRHLPLLCFSFMLLHLMTGPEGEGEGEGDFLMMVWLSLELLLLPLSLLLVLTSPGTTNQLELSSWSSYKPLRNCCCCRNCILCWSSLSLPERTASVWREISVSSLDRSERTRLSLLISELLSSILITRTSYISLDYLVSKLSMISLIFLTVSSHLPVRLFHSAPKNLGIQYIDLNISVHWE